MYLTFTVVPFYVHLPILFASFLFLRLFYHLQKVIPAVSLISPSSFLFAPLSLLFYFSVLPRQLSTNTANNNGLSTQPSFNPILVGTLLILSRAFFLSCFYCSYTSIALRVSIILFPFLF